MTRPISPAAQAVKITENHRILFSLINRSRDLGDGWRQVSDQLWPHIRPQAHPQLTEIDENSKRIRFTAEGHTVMKYLP